MGDRPTRPLQKPQGAGHPQPSTGPYGAGLLMTVLTIVIDPDKESSLPFIVVTVVTPAVEIVAPA